MHLYNLIARVGRGQVTAYKLFKVFLVLGLGPEFLWQDYHAAVMHVIASLFHKSHLR